MWGAINRAPTKDISSVIREVLAVDLYRTGRISFGKAAEIAGVSHDRMTQILAKHDVWLAYDTEDALSDWQNLKDALSNH
ncbi:MAG: UPF0175 family protein [Armatimonadetes bacterium]|nr:UPF0175 family protein [Armatimonadota bacterium]